MRLMQAYDVFEAIHRRAAEQAERERKAEERFTRQRNYKRWLTTTPEGINELLYGHEIWSDREFIAALVEIGQGDDLLAAAYQLQKHIDNRATTIAEGMDDDD